MIENGVGIGWYVRDSLTKEITSEIRCTGRKPCQIPRENKQCKGPREGMNSVFEKQKENQYALIEDMREAYKIKPERWTASR